MEATMAAAAMAQIMEAQIMVVDTVQAQIMAVVTVQAQIMVVVTVQAQITLAAIQEQPVTTNPSTLSGTKPFKASLITIRRPHQAPQ